MEYYAVMRIVPLDSLHVIVPDKGIMPMTSGPEEPTHIIPLFTSQEKAESWAGGDENIFIVREIDIKNDDEKGGLNFEIE